MRQFIFAFFLSAAIFVTGCEHSGDFGTFVVTQVVKYGGHTKTSGAIRNLQARWSVKADKNGFTAFVSDAPFSDIATEMEQIFGEPEDSDDGSHTKINEPYRLWSVNQIGVGIQLVGHKDSTEIVCLREIKDMDKLIKHMPKKRPWWKFW